MTVRFGDRRKNAQHALARPAVRRRRRQLERIELQAAGDRDVRRVGAEVDQTPRRFLALHAEPIDVAEHAAEKRAHQAVARVRAGRDAPVDHHRLDAAAAALAQEVGPDLGLHHDEEPRPHQAQRAADDEGPVEREVEDRVDVRQAAARHLLPGDRRRGQEQTQPRITRLEVGGERARGQRLTDRHRVDPDGFLAVDVERDRQEAEPLPQRADVLLVPDRLVQEVGRHQRGRRPASAGCRPDTSRCAYCRMKCLSRRTWHGCKGWHQRLRPHRPQHHARGARRQEHRLRRG